MADMVMWGLSTVTILTAVSVAILFDFLCSFFMKVWRRGDD